MASDDARRGLGYGDQRDVINLRNTREGKAKARVRAAQARKL